VLLLFGLWAFAVFNYVYLTPNLGLYSEPDWMVDNAGWQRQQRLGSAKHLWKRKLVAPQFGQTVELTLSLDDEQQAGFADLDAGRRALRSGLGAREILECARAEKHDAVACVKAGRLSVEGLDIAALPVSDYLWEKDSPQNVADYFLLEWQKPKEITMLWPLADHWGLERHDAGQPQPSWMLPNCVSTFYVRTREGGMGLLQITGFTENPRGVKVRYKLVQNGPALPAPAPDFNPNPNTIMKTNSSKLNAAAVLVAGLVALDATNATDAQRIDPATGMPVGGVPNAWHVDSAANAAMDPQSTGMAVHQLIAQGQYADALQRCQSLHDQAKTPGALMPVLFDWVELGRRYPQARAALLQIRDHEAREFAEGRGFADLFSEVSAINGALQQDDATYALFKSIRAKDPALARQCYFFVESLLVANGEYQWCYDHMGEAQARFDLIHQSLTSQRDVQKRMSESQQRTQQSIADMNRKNGWTNHPAYAPHDISAMIKKAGEDSFIGQTRQLIEILVATGHQADAENIRDQALALLDDPRLHSAVTDAAAKVRSLPKP
jgi:hypothetical protein